jgi:hypothetical protein
MLSNNECAQNAMKINSNTDSLQIIRQTISSWSGAHRDWLTNKSIQPQRYETAMKWYLGFNWSTTGMTKCIRIITLSKPCWSHCIHYNFHVSIARLAKSCSIWIRLMTNAIFCLFVVVFILFYQCKQGSHSRFTWISQKNFAISLFFIAVSENHLERQSIELIP